MVTKSFGMEELPYLIYLISMTLGCTAFGNLAYPENRPLLYEALSMLATKKNGCSHGNCTSLSTLNKKFLSTFNIVPEMNEFLSKIPPFCTSLLNINNTEHLYHVIVIYEAKMYFRSFLTLIWVGGG